MTTLRCLTVRQQWAWAIVYAGKDVENRSQSTKVRGWVGIHAGKGADRTIRGRSAQEEALAREACAAVADRYSEADPATLRAYQARGAVIGVAHLVDSHHSEDGCCESEWAERSSGYSWHWCFDQVIGVDPPLPARGALGMWRPDDDLSAELEAVLTVNMIIEP